MSRARTLIRSTGALVAIFVAACSDSAGDSRESTPSGGDGAHTFDSGVELRVAVPEAGRVFVKLDGARVVAPADPATSTEWDLAFEGLEIFTNGGASGAGAGAAFGPLDAIVFLDDLAPSVPFLNPDRTGGAFLDWYEYEGAPTHALFSRYHVFGIKDGERLFKVQVLNYYGERDGAPVSALYTVRYAEVTAAGSAPTTELAALDGTAGGPSGGESAPSECLDLGEGKRTMLTPAEATASSAWHLCFRRQNITVNGELGGPRGVGAVDLDAAESAAETLAAIKARTPESERARFDAVTAEAFTGKTFRGDRIVSVFGDAWIDATKSPPAPARSAWLVLAADGKQKFLVGFAAFEASTARAPGTVVMRVKPVKG